MTSSWPVVIGKLLFKLKESKVKEMKQNLNVVIFKTQNNVKENQNLKENLISSITYN
jgi:hypothetical protein